MWATPRWLRDASFAWNRNSRSEAHIGSFDAGTCWGHFGTFRSRRVACFGHGTGHEPGTADFSTNEGVANGVTPARSASESFGHEKARDAGGLSLHILLFLR
jgi:hypothetical protein